MDKGKRIAWVDITKEIGIILVIIGHIAENKIIYSFHMPLFFILSGYLYKNKEKFVRKKIKSILIPYLFFAIVSFLYWYFIERHFREQDVSSINAFLNIWVATPSINYVFNTALWFLPCLFTTEVIFHFLENRVRNTKILLSIIIAFSIIGYLYPQLNIIRLPFGIDSAFIAIGFYFFGYWWKKSEDTILQKVKFNMIKRIIALCVCFIIVIFIPQVTNGMNIGNMEYPFYPIIYITSFAGFCMIYLISNMIKENKVLQYLGQNTLVLLGIHEPIKRVVIEILHRMINIPADTIRTIIIGQLVITALVILVCIPSIYIGNRYLPFLIGRTKEKKRC